MQILQVGLSHQTAPVEVREQLALSEAAIPHALHVLCPDNGCGPGYALEGAILSTCNRLEAYAITECADCGQQDLRSYLTRVTGASQTVFDAH
jgi:glutamyl-tRNA reductase